MIIDQSQWVELTGGGFVGNADVPAGGKALLGPFSWTPTAAEATSKEGHRWQGRVVLVRSESRPRSAAACHDRLVRKRCTADVDRRRSHRHQPSGCGSGSVPKRSATSIPRGGIDRAHLFSLTHGHRIEHRQNLSITGPTGCGKTWQVCGPGNQACRPFYFRT